MNLLVPYPVCMHNLGAMASRVGLCPREKDVGAEVSCKRLPWVLFWLVRGKPPFPDHARKFAHCKRALHCTNIHAPRHSYSVSHSAYMPTRCRGPTHLHTRTLCPPRVRPAGLAN
eukprot:1160247-Pelagomonas_calceolata.AAC.24